MCGIAGYYLSNEDVTTDPVRLLRNLHIHIDHRGGHATGAAWSNGVTTVNTTVTGPAKVYRTRYPTAGAGSSIGILHTRFSTQGSELEQENNHPVRSGRTLLTHNGVIHNDWTLFREEKLPRSAEVDSEVIAALVDRAYMEGTSYSKALEMLAGNMAVAWMNEKNPHDLYLARGSGSPLSVAMLHNGTVIYASTMDCLYGGISDGGISLDDIEWVNPVAEGVWMRFHKARLVEVEEFKPRSYSYTSSTYRSLYGDSWVSAGQSKMPTGGNVTVIGPTSKSKELVPTFGEPLATVAEVEENEAFLASCEAAGLDPEVADDCEWCGELANLDESGLCQHCSDEATEEDRKWMRQYTLGDAYQATLVES